MANSNGQVTTTEARAHNTRHAHQLLPAALATTSKRATQVGRPYEQKDTANARRFARDLSFQRLLVFVMAYLLLLGCHPATSQPNKEPSSHKLVEIHDRLNRTVVFSSTPSRIVSLSPATTELMFALDCGDSLIGATEYCNYPEEANSIPRVGSGPVGTVSLEAILAKKPDLVLCKFDTHQPLIDSLQRLNIPVLALGPESLQELCEEADWLGKALGKSRQANELVSGLQTRAERLKTRAQKAAQRNTPKPENSVTSDRNTNDRRSKVFYQVWSDPLMTVSKGSFIDELLRMAQLENVVHNVNGRYPQVSPELVVQSDPDIILVPSLPNKPTDLQPIFDRSGWQQVSAIKNKRVYTIDSDIISRCGPRMLDGLQQIIESVYGQVAAEDLQ